MARVKRRDHKYIDLLMKMLEDREERVAGQKIAACIVVGNKIISFGENRRKTDPMQKRFGKNTKSIYLHAEIEAIKNAVRRTDPDKLQNATLYVARLKEHNHRFFGQGLSKPCSGCKRAINSFGIDRVVYTTDVQGQYGVY